MPFKKTETGVIWEPNNPKQALFLSLPSVGEKTIFEALMGGGAGSGKSEVLMMYGIVNGWHTHPRFKQLFTRRTYPEISREIIPRSKEMYAPLGAKFFKQDKFWIFPREDQYGSGMEPAGGMIFYGHCENDDDVHNYDGMEVNLWTPDELTSYSEYIYTYIGLTRVRSAVPELPAVIRASGMPGDIGHGWVVKRYIKPAPAGGRIIRGRGGNLRIYIHTTAADNKDGDPNYLQKLEALPSDAERRAKKYGDWSTYEGQVFDELREKKYEGEPENALHVIPKFDIPSYWPRICAIDWGFNALCSIGWGAVSPNRRVYVYRHQVFTKLKIEKWALEVEPYILLDNPTDIVICHSANQNRGDPATILEQVNTALKIQARLGEKDRIGGKQLVHEYLRWEPKKLPPPEDITKYDGELAMWIFRNKGELEYQRYLASFKVPEPETNLPKLLFFDDPDIKLIVDSLKQCSYQKEGKEGKKKEDVAEFSGDDPYDMLRMLVRAADLLAQSSSEINDKLQAIDRIQTQLNSSQDMTAYYRNMRKLEEIERPIIIKRFSGSRRHYRRH